MTSIFVATGFAEFKKSQALQPGALNVTSGRQTKLNNEQLAAGGPADFLGSWKEDLQTAVLLMCFRRFVLPGQEPAGTSRTPTGNRLSGKRGGVITEMCIRLIKNSLF